MGVCIVFCLKVVHNMGTRPCVEFITSKNILSSQPHYVLGTRMLPRNSRIEFKCVLASRRIATSLGSYCSAMEDLVS